MPTRDPHSAVDVDRALDLVRSTCFPEQAGLERTFQLGLEPERFVFRVDEEGRPAGRLPLFGPGGVLEVVDRWQPRSAALRPRDAGRMPPFVELASGGNLTFEPGAQIEHSTAVHPTATAALADVHAIVDELSAMFAQHSVALVSLGLDPWSGSEPVPQQLDHGRYRSMAAYLAARGPAGGWMMRGSTSLQVNVDLGRGRERADRYHLANLLSPVLVGCFSTSPEKVGQPHMHCRRARVWQELDPTRTGFPERWLQDGSADPERAYADAVLDADVMLFLGRDPKGDDAVCGEPGFRFRDWIRGGHPDHGLPTEDDLLYHLTTVFFEVRARGFLELRAIDGLPECWRAAAVAFVVGLLYDETSTSRALELLEGWRPDLRARWWSAAEHGLASAGLAAVADELWTLALDGCERLGEAYLDREALASAVGFRERFPARGRAPADDLRAVLAAGPAAALTFATDPACEQAAKLVEGCLT